MRDRLQGRASRREARSRLQKLRLDQEWGVVEWILDEEKAGRAPSKALIRSLAELILQEGGGDTRLLDKNWVDRFLARNEEITMKPSRTLEDESSHVLFSQGNKSMTVVSTRLP